MLRPETAIVKAAYTDDVLGEIYDRIGFKNSEEKELFTKALINTSVEYLSFKRWNPKRLKPSEQKKLLDDYRKAIESVKNIYVKINKDNPTEAKFHKALRMEYAKQPAAMQEMLRPYITETGYSAPIFSDFLDLLMKVARDAETASVGLDKASLQSELRAWWVSEMMHHWPKNASTRPGLGNWDKKLYGQKSPSRDILYELLKKIEPKVTPQKHSTP